MHAPETLSSPRLTLRRPRADDAAAIFERYSNDPEVTRFLGWPRHRTLDDARAFVGFSDAAWQSTPAGPYLLFSRIDDTLLGSSGFAFETPERAATGFVLARDAWGQGYATEALRAMVALAPTLGVRRLYALCHVDHRASAHVLEKCDFLREGVLERHAVLPQLGDEPRDVLSYARTF